MADVGASDVVVAAAWCAGAGAYSAVDVALAGAFPVASLDHQTNDVVAVGVVVNDNDVGIAACCWEAVQYCCCRVEEAWSTDWMLPFVDCVRTCDIHTNHPIWCWYRCR